MADWTSRAAAGARRDESGRHVVSLRDVRSFAASEGLSLRDVEAELLRNGLVPHRYLRNIGTLGTEGQAALLASSVAVVGCGGLGGWIVELLARVGVGRLALVDGDVFSDNNLNRQVLCTEAALGRNKAETAADRVRQINGAVEVAARPTMLTRENAGELLAGCSLVFDALDNLSSRLVLVETVQALGIPMVHGAVAGWWGQVCLVEPGNGAMASLWKDRGERGVEAVAGTPPYTPSAVASLQVAMGVRILTGKPVSPDLFWLDLEGPVLERLPLG